MDEKNPLGNGPVDQPTPAPVPPAPAQPAQPAAAPQPVLAPAPQPAAPQGAPVVPATGSVAAAGRTRCTTCPCAAHACANAAAGKSLRRTAGRTRRAAAKPLRRQPLRPASAAHESACRRRAERNGRHRMRRACYSVFLDSPCGLDSGHRCPRARIEIRQACTARASADLALPKCAALWASCFRFSGASSPPLPWLAS